MYRSIYVHECVWVMIVMVCVPWWVWVCMCVGVHRGGLEGMFFAVITCIMVSFLTKNK